MVASSATTSLDPTVREAADGADPAAPPPPAGLDPSLCPSVPLSLCPALLDDLTSPHHSLACVAQKHNLSLSALFAWLELPSTREQMALRESAAYRHVRLVAAVNLSTAVHTTVKLLDTFNKSAPADDPFDPAALRAAIHARKAAWLLYRFSRAMPVSEADLARARTTLRATGGFVGEGAGAPAPHGTASVNEWTSLSASHPARATGCVSANANEQWASDTQRPQSNPAHSASRDTTPSAPVPLRPSAPSPTSPPQPSASSESSELESPSPSLDELIAHLESLAASHGIDISDLKDPSDLPDSFLDAFHDSVLAPSPSQEPHRGLAHADAALAATGPPDTA